MKKAILLAFALTLAAAPSFASSLYYSWGKCLQDGGTSSTTLDCSDFVPSASFASYELSAPATGVVAVSGGLDLTVNGSPDLPPFWHMEGGGCNSGGVAIDDARGADCASGNPGFQGSTGQNTDAFVTAYGAGFNGQPNRARVLVSVNRASSNPFTVNASPTRYFAFKLNWNDDNAVEAGGSCTGCNAVVSMALNWILLESAFTNASGDATAAVITSADPGSSASTCANAAGCDIVPAKNKTWGQLKALYR